MTDNNMSEANIPGGPARVVGLGANNDSPYVIEVMGILTGFKYDSKDLAETAKNGNFSNS